MPFFCRIFRFPQLRQRRLRSSKVVKAQPRKTQIPIASGKATTITARRIRARKNTSLFVSILSVISRSLLVKTYFVENCHDWKESWNAERVIVRVHPT
jgi:hypothetical protein